MALPLTVDTAKRSYRHANARKLDGLVAQCLAQAPGKANPREFLMNNAERLDGWLADMARGVFHKHLHGVTAFDLANARDELAGAALSQPEQKAA